MKVLVSAIACHPRQGSEAGVGWKAVTALGRKYDLHVLTSIANKEAIESTGGSDNLGGISFTYFGSKAPYHANRLTARVQSWLRYLDWIKESQRVAARVHTKYCFDLVHHVTYSSWRVPSPLWSLGIPLVWGPVGGVAEYPRHLLGKLAPRSALFESMRALSNRQATRSSALRNCVRNSSAVIASNKETFDKLLALRGTSDGMYQLFPTFFTDQQIAMFKCDPEDKPPADPIHLFAGGNIIGSKGLIFALEALKLVSQAGINWRLVVGGHGPEVPFLKKRACALGIQAWIEFHMGFSGSEYINKLKDSHVFILPSFRENAGITMLEAMLAGCVPIIADASAQADVVEETSGFKIPVGTADSISMGLAKAVETMARNPVLRFEMGRAASRRVAESFTEDAYIDKLSRIYEAAIKTRCNCL